MSNTDNISSHIWIELTRINGELSEFGMHLKPSGDRPAKTIYFPDVDDDVEVESESNVELISVFVPYRLMKAYVGLVESRKKDKQER